MLEVFHAILAQQDRINTAFQKPVEQWNIPRSDRRFVSPATHVFDLYPPCTPDGVTCVGNPKDSSLRISISRGKELDVTALFAKLGIVNHGKNYHTFRADSCVYDEQVRHMCLRGDDEVALPMRSGSHYIVDVDAVSSVSPEQVIEAINADPSLVHARDNATSTPQPIVIESYSVPTATPTPKAEPTSVLKETLREMPASQKITGIAVIVILGALAGTLLHLRTRG